MKYSLSGDSPADAPADALVGFLCEEPDAGEVERWNALTGGLAGELLARGEFRGKLRSTARIHRPAGMQAGQLLLVGCGPREKLSGVLRRQCAGVAGRTLRTSGARSIAIQPPDGAAARAVVEGFAAALYEPDCYKTGGDRSSVSIESAAILASSEHRGALDRAVAAAEGQRFARELANEPGNILPPRVLAERARAMAARAGLECEILDERRLRELQMGALLGVARGSAEPPAVIVLRYRPREPQDAGGGVRLGLVGKAVTFDTGGISIKPSAEMDRMKYDMAGGAAAIGAMQAVAALQPPAPVTAVIPSVENMPGGAAQRPGDVVTTMSGKTVEVLNTDAEGRLILADALTYAQRQGCTHLVDAATLTGAVVVALGYENSGVFSNNAAWQERLLAAAAAAGEKMWPMPLDDAYAALLESPIADVANIGPRWGGAVTAAAFLKRFADPLPWVHLDIAGTAWYEEQKPYAAKGPSGVAVRTLVELALNAAQTPRPAAAQKRVPSSTDDS